LTATLDPASVPAPSEAAVDAAAPGAEPKAEAAVAPALDENGLPQLAPIPGTVARNAPKRS
ncbi:Sec-independent protein translocase TatB, partial [Corallococcus sp. 4LFB]